jgi:hypothetical protein
MKNNILVSLALFVICTGNAMADPKNGFGINIGGTGNYMASTYTVGSIANPVGSTSNYKSSGASLGLDYQFVFPNNLTLNPFLMLSSESTDLATPTGSVMGHNILGLQGRQWAGDVFIGVHGAIYTETLTDSAGTSTVSESGNGVGIVVGWEPSRSGWSIMLHGDSAKFKYANQDVNMTGARLSIGYRFK